MQHFITVTKIYMFQPHETAVIGLHLPNYQLRTFTVDYFVSYDF
jgi:hypothetical protein